MAEENKQLKSFLNNNDTLDINELASLNDDISPEFIEQLQSKIAKSANEFTGKNFDVENKDYELFEEVIDSTTEQPVVSEQESIEEKDASESIVSSIEQVVVIEKAEPVDVNEEVASQVQAEMSDIVSVPVNTEIENLSSGNIIEKPLSQEQLDYNESLDFLDDNLKYSKYVIYIAPENIEFIDSLTVKERKNLINKLLKEQNDINITKKRFKFIRTVIKHIIISILTITLAIPVIYWTVNASLEASINNYRRSKTMFNTLYKEKGKIRTNSQH